jgi:hypothetical protein
MKCLECGAEFEHLYGLNKHITKCHGQKDYYDRHLKKDDEGICKVCGKETEFVHIQKGYKNCCSRECVKTYTYSRTRAGNLKKYGVENPYQRSEVKQKIKETNNALYGVDAPMQNNDVKKKSRETMARLYGAKTTLESSQLRERVAATNIERYGTEHAAHSDIVQSKIKETNLNRYGNENPMGNVDIREKRRKTMIKRYGTEHALRVKNFRDSAIINNRSTLLKKYGVDHNMHIPEVFDKYQRSCYTTSIYKNTDIIYQASYELDFLERYYDKYTDVRRADPIKYEYHSTSKIYYPDFYIPSLNLIIECKNSYLSKRDKEILDAKKKACLSNGFNYVMIIDKDYAEFDKMLNDLYSCASSLPSCYSCRSPTCKSDSTSFLP